MLRFVLASCLAAAAAGQFVDPASAKILKEQRYNTGAGQFGSAYAQEDGTVSREETINDKGERTGQYSYIGEDGKTYNVKWTAGKDGFRVEGDHIPKGANGLNSAPFNPEEAAPAAPVVQAAAPLPKAAPAPKAAPIPQAAPIDYDYVDVPVDPNFNPFINPHDPTHRDFRFNVNGANHQGAGALNQRTSAAVPNCADCAGVNPFINPFDASHQGGVLAGHLAGHQAGFRAQPQPQPQQPARQAVIVPRIQSTTPTPTRFFPPGKLQLNRFETGFNFDFES